ncbi:MAG: hypothetical protein AB1744_09810, partial [Candidatus Zixiibacteriota bacterium]
MGRMLLTIWAATILAVVLLPGVAGSKKAPDTARTNAAETTAVTDTGSQPDKPIAQPSLVYTMTIEGPIGYSTD